MTQVCPGTSVVEHSTHNSKISGSNPATGKGWDKKKRKKLKSQFFSLLLLLYNFGFIHFY
jgi:hypothetical protein